MGSVVNPVSYENITAKWHKEDPSTTEKLKGLGQDVISQAQGEALAKKLDCVKYIECSAKTGENLKTVFDEAVKAVLFGKTKKKSGCPLPKITIRKTKNL